MALSRERRRRRLRRLRRMEQRGRSDSYIIDRLNGRNNGQVIYRHELRALGWGPQRIERFMRRQYAQRNPGPGDGAAKGPGGELPTSGNPAQPAPEKTSAFQELRSFLTDLGIPWGADIELIIKNAVIDGYGPENIGLIIPDIQETKTWKDRFPGWHQRVANGYNQLDVGEYLALEDEYHRRLQEAGLPAGFYDDPSDFGKWIAGNVSPDEVGDRVNKAVTLAKQVDPTARDLLTKFYGVTTGDLASYFLDQKRALPALERQFKAVNVAAFAARNGLQVDASTYYEDLIDRGVTPEMAAQGYSTVRAFNDAFSQLANTYGDVYSQRDAEEDVFFNNNEKRRKLLAKEIANFSGSSRGATGTADRGTSY